MKKYLYILATMFIGATAFTGCSSDDNTAVPTPTPTPVEETDVVDLGLTSGTLWATANLGATNNYETGNLYAWGETYVKSNYSASNYFDPSSTIVKSNITGTDYDAAKIGLGGEWVMPTAAQFEELFSECKVTRTTIEVDEKEVKVLKLVGPNEKVIYLPEATGSVTNSGTLYDSYLDEKEKENFAKFENVFATYWTGDIAASSEQNANQYAKQAIYVEHAKDAVKKGGADQYGGVTYNRSRLMGAPIRPVKASGGTPVSEYVSIKGQWAQCDASGTPMELSSHPQFLSLEGTDYSGEGVIVAYGERINTLKYSRNINEVTFDVAGTAMTGTVAEVGTTKAESEEETGKRIISLTSNGETLYFVETKEVPAVKGDDLAGKWDFTYADAAYTINIINTESGFVTKGEGDKEAATFVYRFGTFAITSTSLNATFGVEAVEGATEDECPFQFTDGENTITLTVHPKEYEAIFSWNGSTDTEAPSIFTLNSDNTLFNDPGDGSKIKKDMMNMEGTSNYPYAIRLNKSVASTTVGEKSTQASDIATLAALVTYKFKAGDRIRIRGFVNASGKNGSFKVFDSKAKFLGTGDVNLANYHSSEGKARNVNESVFTFTADTENVYLSREAGTGTFVCEFYIDREKEE